MVRFSHGETSYLGWFWAVLLVALSSASLAQQHTDSDRNYMSSLFDGVWFLSATQEILRIRIEPVGLSILIGEEMYLRDAEIVDINREEKAITFNHEEDVFTIARVGNSIRFSMPAGVILMAERSRRLTKQDIETLDFWYQFKPNPCGMFNQHCEEE